MSDMRISDIHFLPKCPNTRCCGFALLKGNANAKLRPTQVVDINGKDGTFIMQVEQTLPAFGHGPNFVQRRQS
jgi:hypothetical protein